MRDPAQGVISKFFVLILAFLVSLACLTGWALWELGRLVCAVLKG